MITPVMESFLERLMSSLNLVRSIPMQDFVQISENFEGCLVAISINCLKPGYFQIRLHLVGDIMVLGTEVKDVGALSYYGNKEEVMVWSRYNLPVFISLIRSMKVIDNLGKV